MEDLTRQRTAYAQSLETSVERLVSTLSSLPNVERISVFGSYARGRRDLFTDLDVLVIMETEEGVGRKTKLQGA